MLRSLHWKMLLISFLATSNPLLAYEFRDADWNVGLFANCAMPVDYWRSDGQPPSVEFTSVSDDNKLKFLLNPGDEGKCSSDSSARDGARNWERAELRAFETLDPGNLYSISFTVDFTQGFVGKRETFFQIQGLSRECASGPLLMVQFHWRYLRALVLKPGEEEGAQGLRGDLASVLWEPPDIKTLSGSEHRFEIELDMRASATLSMALDGHNLIRDEPLYLRDCAKPYVKLGIYRPGGLNPARSEILFDDIRIDQLGKDHPPGH